MPLPTIPRAQTSHAPNRRKPGKTAPAGRKDRLLHTLAATATEVRQVENRLRIFPEAVHELGAHNDLPLHRACLNKSAHCHKIVKLLLKMAPEAVRSRGRDNALPLHIACANTASVKVVKDLVAMYPGAAALMTSRGDLPLHHACLNQTAAGLEILRYVLIPHPTALEVAGTSGDLPLHVACAIQPEVAMVRELIGRNAGALRIRNQYNDLPLHRACFNCHPQAAQILNEVLAATHPVAKGVPLYPEAIQLPGQRNNWALHLASCNTNCIEMVRILVEGFPEACKLLNNDGNSPGHCCMMNQHSDVTAAMLQILIDAHPQLPEMKGNLGNLPLHTAAEFCGSLAAVQLLIATHKWGTFVKNENGELPAHCAQRNRTKGAIKIQAQPPCSPMHINYCSAMVY